MFYLHYSENIYSCLCNVSDGKHNVFDESVLFYTISTYNCFIFVYFVCYVNFSIVIIYSLFRKQNCHRKMVKTHAQRQNDYRDITPS